MSAQHTNVVIVGAGPAGTSAAIHLARAGTSVVVIDKATFPRDKCCGDGLTTNALRQLEHLGLDPRRLPSWRIVTETTWRSPSGHAIDLSVQPNEGVRIAVARRQELDAELVRLAREAGATVLEGHALSDAAVDDDGHITISTAEGPSFRARYAIGADGVWSPLRRRLCPPAGPTYLGEIHAFRQYFRNATGPAKDRLWVSFEPDILPGYVWSFPVGDGGINIGFGVERKPGQSVQWMKDAWRDILQRPHVRAAIGDAEPEAPHKAWPIPAGIRSELLSAHGGRVLFIGDAARVVDPLTGEGIGQALETGHEAATALLDAGPLQPKAAARRYTRRIRMGMAIDNGFARGIARAVTSERGARAAIRLAPAGPTNGRYALRWVFEDNPRAALLTPWRWPERFTEKSGAYHWLDERGELAS